MNEAQQLHATMQAIEFACTSIQINVNPAAAEATILSLCQSPRPYQACQFIIENSQLANARFQAVTAIRDAAIREWSFLSPDEKKSLISFCLSYVMKHASSPEGYVISKISSVAAQLMKRGWLEFTAAEREGFFSEIKLAIVGNHGLDVQFTGINFLESLVSEFAPSTSSALGLPREFHEQCRKSLEQDYLKNFYCWAVEAAQSVTAQITNSDAAVSEARVCATALRFMFQVLNWDFSNSGRVVKNSIDVFSFVAKEDSNSSYTLVQPGPLWRDILITSGHIGWLLGLYGVLREKFSSKDYWIDCPLAVSARKLIVQLCSLTGAIFPSDAGVSQGNHLLQLLSGIIQWVHPPDAMAKAIECGRSESELLDGCRGLLSIAAVTNPVSFDDLLKHIRPFGTLSLLSALMCEVIKDLMTKDIEEEPWSWVARDILLDTWTALLTETNGPGVKSLLPPEGINAAANLFVLIVESELKAASASEEKEEYFQASVAAMDERLSSYALIARAAIDVTIPFLTGLFSERFARLHQGNGINDPTTTMEELYSLLLITGHVLADEGEGETPLIPVAIETRFPEHMETEKHPVVVLSWSIIKFAEQSLDPNMRAAFFSPRLMEAIIWFLARWSSTYLMTVGEMQSCKNSVDEVTLLRMQNSRKALLSFSAEYTQGKALLEIIVRISSTTLISYAGEKDLQALTCFQLLGGAVRRKNICAHLVTLDSWRELAHCFTNDRVLFSLHASHQRSLAQTLILSASGIKNSVEANQYIRDVTSHMTAYLNDISGKKDIKSICQQPDIILGVTCLLERLRGASSASEPRTQKAIYEMGFSVMQPILKFLEVYKDEAAVVYLLLKVVVDWVEGQIIYLEPHETALVIDFCMHLLQLYSSHNIGKISLSVSSSLQSEANAEKYRDLRALLQLLQKLCTKDMVDVSSAAIDDQQTSISQVIFVGVHIVSPLITIEMLKYPKLCYDHFALLSHMLEVYPEMIPKLNHEAFSHISGTLDFGLHHQDEEVVGMCLSSLRALALYHYKERGGGRDGLGPHATTYKDANGNLQDGILSRFLRSLMQLILFEDYSMDLVGGAADALFPLILCDHDLYQRLGNELVERQPNTVLKTRMASALHSLTTSDALSPSADRSNMRKFRKNLNQFLIDGNGINDPTTTMEELYSLLLITGHVLADEGEGETPLIPVAIETRFPEHMETEKHPVVVLSWSIIKFAEQSLDPNMRAAFFSPRLMEAIIWFLARWSSTYLMTVGEMQSCKNSIDEVTLLQMQNSRKALLSFSAEYTQGKALLEIIVRISSTTLISYAGEKDLQALTCFQLLGGAVRRKNICAHLVTLDSWRELAHCFTNDRVLFSLHASHQRSLAQTLILSASGIKNSVEANQYIRDVTSHMTAYLNDISGKKDIKSICQQPDIILGVTCLLERLRGASSASEPRTQKAIYEMGFSVMQPILKFLEVYKDEAAVVYLLLKVVVDWVEGQIIYLEPHETALVIDFCMHLLQLYSSHNIGKISLSVSSSLQSEANAEKYRDLRALLQLLQKLCTKDMVDVSSAAIDDQQTSISQVIFVGVHIVSPLITIEMLKYPKLCYDHFALLSHMLEVYPEMIPKLNHEAFSHISGTLDFGLHHQDEEVVGMCLSSLRALALYHYKERGGGRDGLGPHATTYKDANGNLQDGILSRFLRSLMQLILFEDYSMDLVGGAADALFPLILCDHDLYQRLGNELVERQPNTVLKTRMANALHSLTTSDALSPSADRSNMRKFRKNLNQFLIDVRGFLRII